MSIPNDEQYDDAIIVSLIKLIIYFLGIQENISHSRLTFY